VLPRQPAVPTRTRGPDENRTDNRATVDRKDHSAVEPRLRPINAVLGLVTLGEVNPPVLAHAGFRIAALEVPVGVGDARVVIDVLLAQDRIGLLLACEAKSGANVDEEQAAKYAVLDPQAVVLAGSVDLPDGVRPSVAVLYVCQEQHADRILLGLSRAGVAFPVLAVEQNEVQLLNTAYAPESLAAVLGPGATPMPAGIPRVVPCDHDSPVSVVRTQVRAVLVAHLSRRTAQVAAEVVAAETLTLLPIYGQAARNRFSRTVGEALRLIAAAEPDAFEYHRATGNREALVRFLRTPEDHDPRGRTQAYQALARQRSTRRRPAEQDPAQLDLLQELESSDNVASDDQTDPTEEDRA
jgi:hypothetical protein